MTSVIACRIVKDRIVPELFGVLLHMLVLSREFFWNPDISNISSIDSIPLHLDGLSDYRQYL